MPYNIYHNLLHIRVRVTRKEIFHSPTVLRYTHNTLGMVYMLSIVYMFHPEADKNFQSPGLPVLSYKRVNCTHMRLNEELTELPLSMGSLYTFITYLSWGGNLQTQIELINWIKTLHKNRRIKRDKTGNPQ